MTTTDAPARRIVGFHIDEDERQWIADLECGHTVHMRHDPPWQQRPWVLTHDGRAAMVGAVIACTKCVQS